VGHFSNPPNCARIDVIFVGNGILLRIRTGNLVFNVVKGDLFEQEVDVIAQGCNVYGMMGSGIAVAFKRRYPAMYRKYKRVCQMAGLKKDGGLEGSVWFDTSTKPAIACLFTQDHFKVVEEYVHSGFTILKSRMEIEGWKSIAFPAIGCGVAATAYFDIETLKAIAEEIFGESEIEATLVVQ